MRLITAFLAASLALPANAQSWATKEVCDVQEAIIHTDTFTPTTYEDIQKSAASIKNGVGRYWRVISPDGAVSHLWGTVHSNHPYLLALPDQVLNGISQARVIAVERDFTFQSRQEYLQFATRNRFGNNTGSGFSSLSLPFKLQLWIRERIIGLGWSSDAVDYLQLPEIAEILLFDPCNDFAGGIYPIQDSRIQMLGAIAGADILGLESPEALTDKLDNPKNRRLLEAVIGIYGAYLNPEATNEDTSTYFALYLQGRVGEMMAWDQSYLNNLFPDGQGASWSKLTDEYLLNERNVNFINLALPELEQGGMVIAVGAFHLPGEAGMVNMLRGAGFKVERVPVDGEAPS